MPNNCCVPGCSSNVHKDNSYVTAFSFPKNIEKCNKWKKCIPREFNITKYTTVCIHHFAEQHIVREDRAIRKDGSVLVVPRDRLKLTDDAFPSIFPNLPSYLSVSMPTLREPPAKRLQRISERLDDQLKDFLANDTILELSQFKDKSKYNSDGIIAYQIFQTLISENFEIILINSSNQKHFLKAIILERIETESLSNFSCKCENNSQTIIDKCIDTWSNILLNNYSKIKRDTICLQSVTKRKLSSLTSQ